MKKNWTADLTDKDFRNVYEHPDIVKCKNCTSNVGDNVCSNIYSYPTMPEDFGCKNGQEKLPEMKIIDVTLLDRIKCLFGFHNERILSTSQPFYQETLLKCDCCGKYGIYYYNSNITRWYSREQIIELMDNKSFEEMMDKYQL